jgi:hypothetical protein
MAAEFAAGALSELDATKGTYRPIGTAEHV